MFKGIQEPPNNKNNEEVFFAPESEEEVTFAEEENEDEDLFAAEESEIFPARDSWKILIVDDEIEVHQITKLAFADFIFDGKSISCISAYSGAEAKQLIEKHPDTAIILLDVIMENDDSGLDVVRHIRHVLGNQLVRIILRTGQPGQVPEDVVIFDYDIDDYKTKTELTSKKLLTTAVTAIRAFRALTYLEASKQELEKIAAASARFVPKEFLKFLQKESLVDARLGDSVEREMTVMFADIRSFTSLSETMSPKDNFDFINSYLSRMGPIIREHNGFIDKYIGDGIMALFPDSADDAVAAAIEMQKQVVVYNSHRANIGYEPISIGIGLHTGELMLGTIGEDERMESTVISDGVNLASRIEGLTKVYGVGIAVSEETMGQLREREKYHCRFLGKVQVKGKKVAVGVFEIYDGDGPEAIALKTKTRKDFERGIELYQDRQIEESCEIFAEILQTNPQDRAAKVYVKRCEKLQKFGTPEGWEAVETFEN